MKSFNNVKGWAARSVRIAKTAAISVGAGVMVFASQANAVIDVTVITDKIAEGIIAVTTVAAAAVSVVIVAKVFRWIRGAA